MIRIITYLKHNALAAVALFIALGGTSYAAVAIPKDSVGSRQLRNGAVSSSKLHSGAVTPGKLSSKSFGGRILYLTEIANNGAVQLSDPKGIRTENWNLDTGGGVVFPHRIPKGCFPLAGSSTSAAGTSAEPASVGAQINNSTSVVVGVSGPTSVTLAIVCER